MIPGVSRSGATIVGAMLLGADKRSAAEFSFFLAMPTMAGAFAYDLYKNYKFLDTNDMIAIGVGFAAAGAAGAAAGGGSAGGAGAATGCSTAPVTAIAAGGAGALAVMVRVPDAPPVAAVKRTVI
jgi:hypothetical protein